ncbi:MAG TPA: hypothetical protein VIW68_07810 [Candidatus Sulfotelmatobacter sp.]
MTKPKQLPFASVQLPVGDRAAELELARPNHWHLAAGHARLSSSLAIAVAIILGFALLCRAGGPKYVAGTSYFLSTVAGQPLTWQQGQITYYTDQGDLSPILANADANAFVATAFSVWTSVPTAALAVSDGGQLAEDVNGSNVIRNPNGTLTEPTDIQPSATTKPVSIVYDYDGTVTDALLGSGAGDASQCFSNAAFGGVDNFGTDAYFLHALVVMNGQCALLSSQLPDLEYHLLRVLGNVMGLGWSQLNLNVITGNPTSATGDDYAGFPLMHDIDPLDCVPLTFCYPNPIQVASDDQAAISRLYPVTAANQSSFPGSQIFSATTARIFGSVYFVDPSGGSTVGMQGVNVVARWIDPSTGLPSGQFAVSSVSGFLFNGDEGNSVTGFNDPLGTPYTEFGALDPGVEGFFDLGGLPFPNGASSAQYQLTVEGLDPTWSVGVGPYAPLQVPPSGGTQPIMLTVAPGSNLEQDILMSGSAQPVPQWAASETWTTPAAIPAGGDWAGSISGPGGLPWFSLAAKANRTLSVAITSLDESGNPSASKMQPVVGMWPTSAPQGSLPGAFTPSSFNTGIFGVTRLDAQILISSSFLIGVSDWRGDGRPDYHYHAHVLYADAVTPARVGVNGGTVVISGTGFGPGLAATVGSTSAAPLAVGAGVMIVDLPPQADGVQTITVTDPASGSFSVMTGAVTFGAATSDNLVVVKGTNPPTPIGTQAINPVVVHVVAAGGIVPVAGATIRWTASNSAALSACNGASTCSVASDESGLASTGITPALTGSSTLTATLAPASYSSPKSVSTTVEGTESSLDIGLTSPYTWVVAGSTLTPPLTARVLDDATPLSGTVNFAVALGSGTLSSSSAATNGSGYASVALTLTNVTSQVQVRACVAPNNSPCQSFYITPVALSLLALQPVAGAAQAINLGQPFQPVVVRVTDSARPPDPVLGASVAFQTTVLRPTGSAPAGGSGGDGDGNPALPVILSVSQTTAQSDVNGLASLTPSTGGFSGPLEIQVAATAGTTAAMQYVLQAFPAAANGNMPNQNDSSQVNRGENQPLAEFSPRYGTAAVPAHGPFLMRECLAPKPHSP